MKFLTILFVTLISISIICNSQPYVEITDPGFADLGYGSFNFSDLDNDGFIDIVICGIEEITRELKTQICYNNQDGTFQCIDIPDFPKVYSANIALGDYNQDALPDILIAGDGYDPLVQLWKNEGLRSFSRVEAQLANVSSADANAEFRDYDNDGDLDILLSGFIHTDLYYIESTKIYKNEGNDHFTEIQLTNANDNRSGIFGDSDSDGDLDLLTNGWKGFGIHKNNGQGNFDDWNSLEFTFPAGIMKWFDYDNDGKLDIIISGRGAAADDYFTRIMENTGNPEVPFVFLENTPFVPLMRSSIDIKDYDDDGDMDILMAGTVDFDAKTYIVKIYDFQDGNYIENTTVTLPQLGNSCARWFDLENDGDYDMLISGEFDSLSISGCDNEFHTILLRNELNSNTFLKNTSPSIPTNLNIVTSQDSATLSWDRSSDNETPQNQLSYNVAVNSFYGDSNFIYVESDVPTGTRFLPQYGNAQTLTTKFLRDMSEGLYYGRVQSIDAVFSGSGFSAPELFAIGIPAKPASVTAEVISSTEIDLYWEDSSVNEFRYVIEQQTNLTPGLGFEVIGQVGTDTSSFTTQYSGDGIYSFRIKSENPNGSSEYSISDNIAVGIPHKPDTLLLEIGLGIVELSWNNMINELGFILERSFTGEAGTYETIAAISMNDTTYSDPIVQYDYVYYRLKAVNPNGESPFVYAEYNLVLGFENLNDVSPIVIYPNPAKDMILIDHIDKQCEQVILYDITNNILFDHNISKNVKTLSINLSGYKPGLYFLVFQGKSRIVCKRIIVE
jgi:hypothetical protein